MRQDRRGRQERLRSAEDAGFSARAVLLQLVLEGGLEHVAGPFPAQTGLSTHSPRKTTIPAPTRLTAPRLWLCRVQSATFIRSLPWSLGLLQFGHHIGRKGGAAHDEIEHRDQNAGRCRESRPVRHWSERMRGYPLHGRVRASCGTRRHGVAAGRAGIPRPRAGPSLPLGPPMARTTRKLPSARRGRAASSWR